MGRRGTKLQRGPAQRRCNVVSLTRACVQLWTHAELRGSFRAHVCTVARSSLVSVGANASRADGSAPRPLANHLSSSATEAGAWRLTVVGVGTEV